MNEKLEEVIIQTLKDISTTKEELKEIELEIRDHLYSAFENYLQIGYPYESATNQAITDYGKTNNVSLAFNEIVSPMNNLIKNLIWVMFIMYLCIISYKLIVERLIYRIIQYLSSNEPDRLFYVHSNNVNFGEGQFFDFSMWQSNINIIPFNNVMHYVNNFEHHRLVSIDNLLGNLVILLPLGFFLPVLFKKCTTLSLITSIAFLSSFFIEFVQFIIQIGRADIDDVLLNTFGAMMGYYIARLYLNLLKRWRKRGNKNEVL